MRNLEQKIIAFQSNKEMNNVDNNIIINNQMGNIIQKYKSKINMYKIKEVY